MKNIYAVLLMMMIVSMAIVVIANDDVVVVDSDVSVDSVVIDSIDRVISVDSVDSVDIDNQDIAVDTLINADTVDVAEIQDISTDTLINTDTIDVSSSNPDTTLSPPKPQIPIDTASPPKLSGTYLGFGVGLSIGSIPLFTTWQGSLLNDMTSWGLNPRFGRDTLTSDTAMLRYRVEETPEEFNIILPLYLSILHVNKNNNNVASFSLSFFHNSKQSQSLLFFDADTLGRRINMHEKMTFTSLTVEAGYQWAIPPIFFSIDGAQQTYLSLSAGISPLNYFSRSSGVKNSAPENDVRMSIIEDTVRTKLTTPLSANGTSVLWRFGINTIKAYRQGGGLEMGLFYCGTYNTNFYNAGENVTENQISASEREIDKPLSFFSTRIEFKISFMIPAKREVKKDEDGEKTQ